MARKLLLAAGLVLAAGLLLTVWASRQATSLGYGNVPRGSGNEDELLGGRLLDTTDWAPFSPTAARGEHTTERVEIDGRPGKRERGWYVNGKPEYEEEWVGDKHHGREVWWDEQGQKVKEQHWKDGYLQGRSTPWYPDGTMAEDAPYERYHLHGTHRTWYRNGQERCRTEYGQGLRHGEFLAWYPSGVKQCQASFKNDRLDGEWQTWDADGKSVKRVEYRGGVAVSPAPADPGEPLAYPGPLGARDFAFILAQGSGWHGYDTLRVSARGKCEFYYFFTAPQVASVGDARLGLRQGDLYHSPVWRKAEFRLSNELQRQLRDALRTADLFGMQDQYIDRQVADGTQWVLRLRTEGREKRISCSNTFPEPLRQLSRALRDSVMAPHVMELLTATRIEEDGYNPDKDGWLEDGGG
jgi:antitoxin component YwqK of YwqJK toxin-antitoxin module